MKKVNDVKEYILRTYPNIAANKFDVVKTGSAVYIFLVTQSSTLEREQIFKGAIETVETEERLKRFLEDNIRKVMIKNHYC